MFEKCNLIIPIIFVSIIIMALLPYYGRAETNDWKTYRNVTYGMMMDYPSTWLVNESISPENIVAFHNPRTDETQNFTSSNSLSEIDLYNNYSAVALSSINVPTEYGYKNITLKDYTAIKLDNILRDGTNKIVKFENYSMGGFPAYKIEYAREYAIVFDPSEDTNGHPISENYTEAWTVKNNTVYVISSIIDNTDANMKKNKYDIVQKIIDSFDFL